MSNYEYKVVPFTGKIKGKQTAQDVSEQLKNAISISATNGWEFYQLGEVDVGIAPGCLAALLGAKESYVKFDQLIFRKKL